jgi:hypothetical protein
LAWPLPSEPAPDGAFRPIPELPAIPVEGVFVVWPRVDGTVVEGATALMSRLMAGAPVAAPDDEVWASASAETAPAKTAERAIVRSAFIF